LKNTVEQGKDLRGSITTSRKERDEKQKPRQKLHDSGQEMGGRKIPDINLRSADDGRTILSDLNSVILRFPFLSANCTLS
jgi:hypothetical protein